MLGLRLTIGATPSIMSSRVRSGETIEGTDAEDLLDNWNAHGAYSGLAPDAFRSHMAWHVGLEEVPESDDELLVAIVDRCPDLKLEQAPLIAAGISKRGR